jgi:starch synthase
LLKGALVYANLLNTVSPTYAREIQTAEFGSGLEGVLQVRKDRLFGVTNGIDYETWNPATDPHLAARYSVDDLSGKRVCKAALQKEMGLPARDVPLIGIVSRLAFQKGIDLNVEMLPKLLALDVQMVILGDGEPSYHRRLTDLADHFADKLAVRLAFDEGLAHRIEAGADFFLMPSRYEPCGLSQMYSLRYGTVPIVRRTGGLADTVVPYLPDASAADSATGFAFESSHPEVLLSTVLLALRVYRDKEEWQALVRRGMRQDNSWRHSAKQYIELYERARSAKPV